MGLHVRRQGQPVARVQHHRPLEQIDERGTDERHQHRDAHEVHQELPHRQCEDEERSILLEQRIGVAERAAVQEQQDLLPAAGVARSDYDGHDDGSEHKEYARPSAPALQLQHVFVVAPAAGEESRRDRARQPQAAVEDAEEDRREDEEDAQLGQERGPEDRGLPDLGEPEIVGPDAGDHRAQPEEDHHEDDEDHQVPEGSGLHLEDPPAFDGLGRFLHRLLGRLFGFARAVFHRGDRYRPIWLVGGRRSLARPAGRPA